MAAQKGSAVLIKVGDGATPTEVFTTIGGLRSSSISFADEMVDVTTKDSSNDRTLLANGGTQSVSISGSGVFTDAASEGTVRGYFGATAFKNFQFVIPELGTYEGAFQLTALEYAGEYNGEATYSMSFESSGSVGFTAA